MNMIQDKIKHIGVVPVVKLDDASEAVPLAKALIKGGVPLAEVTFRTDAAEDSIRLMAEQVPDVMVGAGTVLTTQQVDAAYNAGAKFIVSPGFDAKVVEYCLKLQLPVFPGCVTPTEIMDALSLGLTTLKFFPANIYGGLAGIKALSAPFPQVRFMPTGGVSSANLAEYLRFDRVIACGGSWMVKSDLEETICLCTEAKKIVEDVRR